MKYMRVMNLGTRAVDAILKFPLSWPYQYKLNYFLCEYACQLWNPHCKKDILLIENIQ